MKTWGTCDLMSDESSDACRDGLTNYCVSGSEDIGALLFTTRFAGEESQNAENLTRELEEVRQKLRETASLIDTSYLSDNCPTANRVRQNYAEETNNLIHGCFLHFLNKVNEGVWDLDIFKDTIDKMEHLQNKIRNTKLKKDLKPKILRERIITSNQDRNIVATEGEISQQVSERINTDRVSIPKAGDTRHFNNLFDILNWQCNNEKSIKLLYVFCYNIHLICVCVCCNKNCIFPICPHRFCKLLQTAHWCIFVNHTDCSQKLSNGMFL